MAKPDYVTIIVEVYESGRVSGKHGSRHIRPAEGQTFPQNLDVECDRSAQGYAVGQKFEMDVIEKYREGRGKHLYSYHGWPLRPVS